MNPNEVQQPIPAAVGMSGPRGLNSAPQTAKRKIVISILIIIGIVAVVLILNFFHLLSFSKFFKPKSISKRVVPTTILAKGTLTAISGTSLTVSVYNMPQVFSIARTKDIQKVISGTMGKSDAKVGLSSVSELKVGQEVLIIADKDSTLAKTVYILH